MSPAHEQIRRAWRLSGLTHEEVARKAGVSENTVCRVLGGSDTRLSTIAAIAGVFGIDALLVKPHI